jgi:hypothetical protein
MLSWTFTIIVMLIFLINAGMLLKIAYKIYKGEL